MIMGFGEVLQQVDEQNTALRVPHVRIEEIPVARVGSSRGRPNSPSTKKSALRQLKTFDVAPSSYYKVSLSTEKAKRRQSSLG